MLSLENDALRIGISETDGSISRLFDKAKQMDFLLSGVPNIPFRLERTEGWTTSFEHFSYSLDDSIGDSQSIRLQWQISPNIYLKSAISLQGQQNQLSWEVELANESAEAVLSVEYPIMASIKTITEAGHQDYLAHSFATGFRIRNPIQLFINPEDGLRYMPYPEGFSGSTMQFFTYYGEGKGGFYFAAYDADYASKWLNCYKGEGESLSASFIHGCEDIGPGKGIKSNYPVVLQLLEKGNWYEAADIYKKWAVQQKWCDSGPMWNKDKENKAGWLMEEIGLATFGVNAKHDRSEWIRKYQEACNTRIFHILGPDWPKVEQNFYNSLPGGLADWFPASFHPANMAAIHEAGDACAPFEFDYLFGKSGSEHIEAEQAVQIFPERIKSIDKYPFPFICPICSFTKELHLRRDERLVREHAVDAVYYDISANNIMQVCMNEKHDHPLGAGRLITQAYHDNYTETKEAIHQAAGKYIAMGTEMINEVFLDVLDYYQARAGGQPAAALEGWNLREWIKSGEAELIPMFAYVYHEYGAVRLDGWGKLVEEIGELFYFTVARTYLWGGLYELNYEYSPKELLNSKENKADEHYYIFQERGYSFSQERASYISQFAALRTGDGNRYLSYGKMLQPFSFQTQRIELSWFHYNCDKNFKEYEDGGSLEVDAVVHSAWSYRDESAAFFFANVSKEARSVDFILDSGNLTLAGDHFIVKEILTQGVNELAILGHNEQKQIKLSLPPLGLIMVEVSKQRGAR